MEVKDEEEEEEADMPRSHSVPNMGVDVDTQGYQFELKRDF